MNVIRHDYVTTNGDVEVAGTLGISYKCRVDIIARQKWLPQVGAKGHKIERARVKEATETRGRRPKPCFTRKPVAMAL